MLLRILFRNVEIRFGQDGLSASHTAGIMDGTSFMDILGICCLLVLPDLLLLLFDRYLPWNTMQFRSHVHVELSGYCSMVFASHINVKKSDATLIENQYRVFLILKNFRRLSSKQMFWNFLKRCLNVGLSLFIMLNTWETPLNWKILTCSSGKFSFRSLPNVP